MKKKYDNPVSHSVSFLKSIRITAKRKILFLPHALSQMSRPERMISASEVRTVIEKGEIIEDYPEDKRGHSCLMLGKGINNRVVQVVCTPREDYLAIITAYLPSKFEWKNHFRERK